MSGCCASGHDGPCEEVRQTSKSVARSVSQQMGYGTWTNEPTGPSSGGTDADAKFLQELMEDKVMAPVMAGVEKHVRQTLATVEAASKAIAAVDDKTKATKGGRGTTSSLSSTTTTTTTKKKKTKAPPEAGGVIHIKTTFS